MKKAIVIFSGGPDSTAAVLWAISNGYSVELVTFQFHNEQQYGEIRQSMVIARLLGLPHFIIDFKSPLHAFPPSVHILMHSGVDKFNPESQPDKSPYLLPFGSGIILSFAASYAIHKNVATLIWGATKNDTRENEGYKKDFADKMAAIVSVTTGFQIEILVPFHDTYKHEFLNLLTAHPGLAEQTWSCIYGNTTQCGQCPPCVNRRLSFKIAGINDPTDYTCKQFTSPLTDKELEELPGLSERERFLAITHNKGNC